MKDRTNWRIWAFLLLMVMSLALVVSAVGQANQVLFSENFEGNDFSYWDQAITVVDDGSGNKALQTPAGAHSSWKCFANQTNFGDAVYEFRFKVTDPNSLGAGVYLRYEDTTHLFVVSFALHTNPGQIRFCENGEVFSNIILGPYSKSDLKDGNWHTLKVSILGREVKLYYDGTLLGTGQTREEHGTGKIGVTAYKSYGCLIDDIKVTEK